MATKAESVEIAVLQNQMIEVKATLVDMKAQQHSDHVEVLAKIDGLDNKYASKETERLVKGMVALILIAFMTALIALVIIPATRKQSTTGTSTQSSPGTAGASGTSGTPSANANAAATADGTKQADSQSSGGAVESTLKQLGL